LDRKPERRLGWEVARDLERDKTTIWARVVPEWRQVRAALGGVIVFFLVFLLACWLAAHTPRLADSRVTISEGWAGTGQWRVFWSVVALALFFEFMDASAGMGFGTAVTPILLIMGFAPLQIVPVVMIQQGVAGLVGAFLHREFQNVEWRLRPLSETVRLCLIISVAGIAAVAVSITAVYKIFKVAAVWIELYAALLLLGMGVVTLVQARRERVYRPLRMTGFAALAGVNKGIGGGGYGPVVTLGGIMSGVPVKSMLAVTALTEGVVSTAAVAVWLLVSAAGVTIDFVLLPSMMLATMIAAVAAPYFTRVFPERLWRFVVPAYALLVAGATFWEVVPDILEKLGR
jgi:uncharacterized protein